MEKYLPTLYKQDGRGVWREWSVWVDPPNRLLEVKYGVLGLANKTTRWRGDEMDVLKEAKKRWRKKRRTHQESVPNNLPVKKKESFLAEIEELTSLSQVIGAPYFIGPLFDKPIISLSPEAIKGKIPDSQMSYLQSLQGEVFKSFPDIEIDGWCFTDKDNQSYFIVMDVKGWKPQDFQHLTAVGIINGFQQVNELAGINKIFKENVKHSGACGLLIYNFMGKRFMRRPNEEAKSKCLGFDPIGEHWIFYDGHKRQHAIAPLSMRVKTDKEYILKYNGADMVVVDREA